MRRTTQWAVFTSMNQQQSGDKPAFDPAARADTDAAPERLDEQAAPPRTRSTPDTRRDRVDFM